MPPVESLKPAPLGSCFQDRGDLPSCFPDHVGVMKAQTRAVWLLISAALIALTDSHAAVFHVAPAGNDNNPGTGSAPFASLERAREAVRMAGSNEARRVVVHGGS